MNGMAIFGAVLGGLAMLGILLAYAWGEAKTPGWGWKKQVENPTASTAQELNQAGQEPSQVSGSAGTASTEEELNQAVQEASQERQSAGAR